MNYLLTNVKDIGESSRQSCQVDQSIPFLRNPSAAETAQLGNKVFAKSTEKYASNRHVHMNPIQVGVNEQINKMST